MDGTMTPTVPLMHCFSGIKFNPLNPQVEHICIEDIAHHLSNVCRYGGACKEFYSVAQHSYICSLVAPKLKKKKALLHDAAEAYIGDIIAPLKATDQYETYREIEDNLMRVIFERFNIDPSYDDEVHEIDLLVRHTEMRDFGSVSEEHWINEFMLPNPIVPVSPKEAKILFLHQYHRLFG